MQVFGGYLKHCRREEKRASERSEGRTRWEEFRWRAVVLNNVASQLARDGESTDTTAGDRLRRKNDRRVLCRRGNEKKTTLTFSSWVNVCESVRSNVLQCWSSRDRLRGRGVSLRAPGPYEKSMEDVELSR